MTGKMNFNRRYRSLSGGVLLCVLSFLIAGCSASKRMLANWEDRRTTLSRGLADFVDATDRAFGETRVSDAEEIVQVRVDLNPSYYSESEFAMKLPVRIRVPLPAIQRKAKFFFQIDSVTDPQKSLSDASSQIDDNKTITSGFLFAPREKIRTGTKVNVYWRDDNPQIGVKPFIRWEFKPDPFRYFIEQEAYWRTDDRFGAKTSFHVDRLICDYSYARFACSGEYQETTRGVHIWNALIYRRPIGQTLALSTELGASFNPFRGDPGNDIPEDMDWRECDNDKSYARVQVVGKLPIEWLEYAVEPGVDYYWHHQTRWDYGVKFSLRIIVFEAFLRDRNNTSAE